VIVTSDHGEQLGKRGREGHGPLLFEEGIAVPLVLWVPGCEARRVTYPVSLRHLSGTLQALTGIGDPRRTWFSPGELPVVIEEPSGPWHGVKRALISAPYKLVVDARLGGKMLFDLDNDPGELDNLYPVDGPLRARLEREYQSWLDAPLVR
jgi:arylsulfatase A-like enzyme